VAGVVAPGAGIGVEVTVAPGVGVSVAVWTKILPLIAVG
jgi:hypothetical protein